MEYRQLGSSGLRVSALSLGTGTFGGRGPLFGAWGRTDVSEARRLIDICVDAGVTLFDTADVYSEGEAERILGAAVKGRRDAVLLSTKTGLPMGEGPRDWGASRSRLTRAVDEALRRLGTDYVDLLQLHAFDASTPVEELLYSMDRLIAAGKIRYAGVSNYPGWQLMKAQAAAQRDHRPGFVAHQVYYSLVGRAYEHDLMPLAADQGIGALVWSPLGWGRLTGKIGRGRPAPRQSRLHATEQYAPPVAEDLLFRVTDALDALADEMGKSVAQIAINWLLRRPTVSSVIIGARTEAQLYENLGAADWSLTADQIALLDAASDVEPPYPHTPYRQQEGFARLNPPLVGPMP